VGPFNQFGSIIATGGDRVAIGASAATDVFGNGFSPTLTGGLRAPPMP
jgi:hypothetical protein